MGREPRVLRRRASPRRRAVKRGTLFPHFVEKGAPSHLPPVEGGPAVIGPAGRADAGAFLARLLKLDPHALVRLRPVGGGVAEMWAMLPFSVLAVRRVRTPLDADSTVGLCVSTATGRGGGV